MRVEITVPLRGECRISVKLLDVAQLQAPCLLIGAVMCLTHQDVGGLNEIMHGKH